MNLNSELLIVDDVSENIKVVMNVLRENNYSFSFATTGEQALEILSNRDFDLILLDIMMPGMDGFQVMDEMQKQSLAQETPVILLSARVDIESISTGFHRGAVDYITKPFHPEELIARVNTHIELNRSRKILKQNNIDLSVKIETRTSRLLSELEASQKEIIYILTELMESTSDETGKHIKRVADISRYLASLHSSLTPDDEETIYNAAPLHDIGKIRVDRKILEKPGKLTEEEYAQMKEHTNLAHTILGRSRRKLIQAADIIAMQHHEKWDGSGYPEGLRGYDIHIYARIVALADVLDALTHRRVYKEPWSFDATRQYILDSKGKQFDPHLVDLFEANIDEFRQILEE